jgi:hypothetical protein
MERLGLATNEELKGMDGGQKYFRYLYDLETVYGDMIALLNTTAPMGQGWEVQQTGGMCCILSISLVGVCDGVEGMYEFAVCPEGNLHLDDEPMNESYVVGWSFYNNDQDHIEEGDCLYDVSVADLLVTVEGLMKKFGVK